MAAAARIAIADDKELLGYLLQLVQALRYEPVAHHNADSLLNLLGLAHLLPSLRAMSMLLCLCSSSAVAAAVRALCAYADLNAPVSYTHLTLPTKRIV